MERYVRSDIPPTYPRVLDLLPVLSLQQDLDGGLEMNRFVGQASIGVKGNRDEIPTGDPRFRITSNRMDRTRKDIVWDSGNLRDTITQRELWKDTVQRLAIEKPEVTIRGRVTKQPVPEALSTSKEFDGMDSIHTEQVGLGNYYRMMRDRFGLAGLSNPYRLIQDDLKGHDVWNDVLSPHIRSVLKSVKILAAGGGHTRGYSDLFRPRVDKKFIFPPMAGMLNHALADPKWWSDVAIPRRMLGHIDGTSVEAVLYILANRDRIVAI